MSTSVFSRGLSFGIVLIGLLCGMGLVSGLADADGGALSADALRTLVARDGQVLVRVELAAAAANAETHAPTGASQAQEDAAADLLFALPEGSYADVERSADGTALVMRIDASGLDGLLENPAVVGLAPAVMPAAMARLGAGGQHSLAIKPDGGLWAWGNNYFGQLGDGTTANRSIPVPVMRRVATVATGLGGWNSFAVRTDGSLWAWGSNGNGQLGDGTTLNRIRPTSIINDVAAVAVGWGHTLARKTDGSLWAWGWNNSGQLGDGTTIDRVSPTHIMNRVAGFAAGVAHTLAVKADGSLWAWGYNYYGQLGDGTTTDRLRPRRILNDVAGVAASSHTLALKTDGSLWAWGCNESGQLGDGTTTSRPSPVSIMGGVAAIAAGDGHTFALKTDGSLWAWGSNSDGQLGDGTTTDRIRPRSIMNSVAAVATGRYHTLVRKTDGSLWAFGSNRNGQMGIGTTGGKMRHPVTVLGFGPTTPAAPSNVLARAASRIEITLRWRDNSRTEQGFRIARTVGAAAWAPLAEVPANTTRFTDTGLTPNTRYRYRVQAYNGGGTSAFATSTAVKTPR
jgi:alpha-tubulin suppressor-like RCC1 family protein